MNVLAVKHAIIANAKCVEYIEFTINGHFSIFPMKFASKVLALLHK